MRFFCPLIALLTLLVLSGCGYVHFGKLPIAPVDGGALDTAYSDLSTRNKILQQELALARKEGDTLRSALEGRADSAASIQLTARLTETTRELASLRANYEKLSAARSGVTTAPDAALAAKLAATEEKLAGTLRNFTHLQEENARLRTEVDQTRAENVTLTAQVKTVTAENLHAQSALAQLNTELLAQKEARARAEQLTEAAHTQLSAVMSARDASRPVLLSDAHTSTASSAATLAPPSEASRAEGSAQADSTATLKIAGAPPTDKPATAELRTSPERLRAALQKNQPEKSSSTTAEARIHVVRIGDTLERLAQIYYGDPKKWNLIYFANNAQLSGGRPLKPGMELEIPEN